MPYNLLLLPLLGGFWLLHRTHYFRFRAQTLDGNRLLLESALAGVVLAVVARVAVFYFNLLPLWKTCCGVEYGRLRPDVPYFGTAFVSLVIAFVTPIAANFAIRERKAKHWAIARYGNHFLKLVNAAAENEQTVSITLDNRKVYIGFILDAPNLSSSDSHLAVLPLLSGYRDSDTLELRFTTNYVRAAVETETDLSSFQVTVPTAAIKVVSFFDERAYPHFFVEDSGGRGRAELPIGIGDGG